MTHLTEVQIDELLMGSLPTGEAARLREHVAGCDTCAAQLEEIEMPLRSFQAVTLAWSERRSATLPVRPAKPVRTRWGLGFAWGTVAAAALLAAVIPILRHEQNVRVQQAYNNARSQGTTTAPAAPVNPAAAQDDSSTPAIQENPQEIASDNQMLAMVDEELNAPIVPPGSARSNRGHARSTPQGAVQD